MSLFKKYKESRVGRFLKDYAWPLKYRIVALLFLSTVIGVTGAAPSFVIKYLTDDVLVNKNQKVLLLVCLGTMVIMLFPV